METTRNLTMAEAKERGHKLAEERQRKRIEYEAMKQIDNGEAKKGLVEWLNEKYGQSFPNEKGDASSPVKIPDDDIFGFFEAAWNKYRSNSFDMDEAEDRAALERKRIQNWHKCIAWTIDGIDIPSLHKLFVFSNCVIDLENTIVRMRRVIRIENTVEDEPF